MEVAVTHITVRKGNRALLLLPRLVMVTVMEKLRWGSSNLKASILISLYNGPNQNAGSDFSGTLGKSYSGSELHLSGRLLVTGIHLLGRPHCSCC